MHYRIKKLLRYMLIFAAWVFFLSIRIGDRTLFAHAHDLLVDNRIVAAVDAEVSDLWGRITMTAKTAYGRVTPPVALPAALEAPGAAGSGTRSNIEQTDSKTDIALPHMPASQQAKG